MLFVSTQFGDPAKDPGGGGVGHEAALSPLGGRGRTGDGPLAVGLARFGPASARFGPASARFRRSFGVFVAWPRSSFGCRCTHPLSFFLLLG